MRIGELAGALAINPKTIRYYESIGLLPEPARTASGYRDYGSEDLQRLQFVKTAQRIGLALDEIAEIIAFRDRGEQPCSHVRGLLQRQVAELDQKIDDMRRLREELRRLEADADRVGAASGAYCRLIEHVRIGRRPPTGPVVEA
ncbi:MAG: heavy metal-responsive transcriptional regulator [Acidimicrobiales bacterium]